MSKVVIRAFLSPTLVLLAFDWPEGLTTQANVVHTFESPQLAALCQARADRLRDDPPLRDLAAEASWSDPIAVGDATVRAFFPPERRGSRTSIDAVVDAVQRATSSVLFCRFDPTDQPLMDAIFAAGNAGRMMFGLVHHISSELPDRAGSVEVEVFQELTGSPRLARIYLAEFMRLYEHYRARRLGARDARDRRHVPARARRLLGAQGVHRRLARGQEPGRDGGRMSGPGLGGGDRIRSAARVRYRDGQPPGVSSPRAVGAGDDSVP